MAFAYEKNTKKGLTKKATSYLLGFSYKGSIVEALKKTKGSKRGQILK
ncbi:hypothetical protein MMK73_003033 [Providencia rettgeri]|nr:hypothetical protein [Providencia rettgeri]